MSIFHLSLEEHWMHNSLGFEYSACDVTMSHPSLTTFFFFFIFFYLNSISYSTSAVFSVSRSSSGCQSEQYRLVDIQY